MLFGEMPVLHLHNIKVISAPAPHRQPPDDLLLVAKVLVGTNAIASSEETRINQDGGLWMLKVKSNIPSENGFSIQISGRRSNETTYVCYGSIQADAKDLISKVNNNSRYTLEQTLGQQTVVTPSFRILVGFSVDLNSDLQISAADQRHFPLDENSIVTLLQAAIQGGSEGVKPTDLTVIYDSIQQLPTANRYRSPFLYFLGEVNLQNYDNTQCIGDLHKAINAYSEAYQEATLSDPQKALYLAYLGAALQTRFERLGDLDDLNRSVSSTEEAVQLTQEGQPEKPLRLSNLGNSLFRRFERLGDLDDINQAVSRNEEAVRLTPDDHPEKPLRLNNLGNSLFRRFERLGHLNDINQSVSRNEEALQLTPEGHSCKPFRLNSLANSLACRFQRLGDLDDINKSVSRNGEAVQLTNDGDLDKLYLLNNLGTSLACRFQRLGDVDDINQSVSRLEEAVQLAPAGYLDKASLLTNLGKSLLVRSKRLGDLNDINQSVSRLEEAVQLTPHGHPDKPSRLTNLGKSLTYRFEHFGDLDDINQSVSRFEEAMQLTPDEHPDKIVRLNNLGSSLLDRFECLGDLDDINKSVSRNEEAVELTQEGHPVKASSLNNLGNSLFRRFQRLGHLNDINQSVSRLEEAVQHTPEGHPEKPLSLINFGNSLLRRFQRLGDLDDINQSVSRKEEAVQLTPDRDPEKPSRLNNLGNSLLCRFEHLGDFNDINHSVSRFEEAVRLTPDGHPIKPSRSNNLGSSLFRRFEHFGDLNDINQAVSRFEEAVQLTPATHPNKLSLLNNLGNSLLRRFQRLGNLNDIHQSVSRIEEAVQLTPKGHPHKPFLLNNLGNSLSCRFEHLGDLYDINQAVSRNEEAVELIQDGHPSRPPSLNNLGNSLLDRFERLGDLNDINQSVLRFEEAVRLTPDCHPDKPSWLKGLGNSLLCRFQRFRDLNDLKNAIQSNSTAALSIAGPAIVRFHAAIIWALCLTASAQFGTSSIVHSYATALELLPSVAWQGLTMADRQYRLLEAGLLVRHAVSAAIEIEDFHKAVEWFDQGHSVIWSQLFNLRTNYDDLKMKHPQFATRLTMLSKELEGSSTRNIIDDTNRVLEPDPVAISQRYHDLAHQRQELLTSIRNLEGFDRFLLPRRFTQLQRAARDRTVVLINISKQRCDALVLIHDLDNVLHIPLKNFDFLTAEELQKCLQDVLAAKGCRISEYDNNNSTRVPPKVWFGHHEPDLEHILAKWKSSPEGNRKFQPISALQREHRVDSDVQFQWILKELWERVVKPVLEGLAFPEDKRDHELPIISWCLTGPLTFLPIHAAGIYDDNMGPKLSDYVISSYIPTLSNLLPRSQPKPAQKPQVLAVALPIESELMHTDVEVSKVTDAASESELVESVTLMEENATADKVAKHMEEASFVHFACHGCQNLNDPNQSALLLANKAQLTLERISRLHLPNAELAFLSACQTATGDEKLAQEAVHLAAGMLLAGYRGVVATMWSIQDSDAPIVAEEFYRTAFSTPNPDATHAARALHKAVNKLKEEVGESSFLSWVPFIHMGV